MARTSTRSPACCRAVVALSAICFLCAPLRASTLAAEADPLAMQGGDDFFERSILPARYGREGEWWWSAAGGVGLDLRRSATSYSVHVAASYFFVEDFSLDLQGSFFFLDQEMQDSTAGSLALILRRHWRLGESDNTFFLDAGCGFLIATERVPAGDGAQYGFTPQLGVGLTIPVGDQSARLILGAKWHHVSTARLNGSENNQGRDALLFHVGVIFPF